ncbi:hypothetical protein JDV02_006418 [Purpureocillium takamizusanense]|uniref:Uncharacterized protein n=1 Tax=Purpureocillium takamizusanense TaxID=2060973 RepID=A0A9Q8QII1_9HYPO|nr:uncharacterized protein JDV02_006418 [Purpureocillium takamizusanense]UNI20320.1 hypothetical protein JDV02_006418 [Purpureocillium takamizusanense]
MGPPRTRAQRLAAQQAARSRFREGSMGDRVSAAPPVDFIFGPGEREALEKPVFGFAAGADEKRLGGGGSGDNDAERRNPHPEWRQQQEEEEKLQPQPPHQQQPPAAAPQPPDGRRKALLGQMWEGLRGRLRLRRDPGADADAAAATMGRKRRAESKDDGVNGNCHTNAQATQPPLGPLGAMALGGDRPTREEVYANYHQLVASGFFSSHAIHSTRRPGPSQHQQQDQQRPATSHDARSPNHARYDPPQWPLAMPAAPANASLLMTPQPPRGGPSPICSPASAASSRGTKRAAEDDDDDGGDGDDRGSAHVDAMTGVMRGSNVPPAAAAPPDEDASTLAHRFLPKRLRKSASRDISLPKLRAVTTRRGFAGGRRSISMVAEMAGGSTTTTTIASRAAAEQQHQVGTKHGANKPAKRVPGSSFPNASILAADPSSSSSSLAPPRRQQTQSLRSRHAGDDDVATAAAAIMPGAFFTGGPSAQRQTSARSLRSKAAAVAGATSSSSSAALSAAAAHATAMAATQGGPLSVVPDANRGIPNVPAIPAKFTYGEDRENGVPWRGLRR